MKYLISFNESFGLHIEQKKQEIQEFCNDNLVDLLDLGYEISVSYKPYGKIPYFSIYINAKDGMYGEAGSIKWSDIKDYFIPFLEFLNEKYVLNPVKGQDKYVQAENYYEYVSSTQSVHPLKYEEIWNFYTLNDILEDSISSQPRKRWENSKKFKSIIIEVVKNKTI